MASFPHQNLWQLFSRSAAMNSSSSSSSSLSETETSSRSSASETDSSSRSSTSETETSSRSSASETDSSSRSSASETETSSSIEDTTSTPVGALLTRVTNESPYNSSELDLSELTPPPTYTVEIGEDGRIVRHGDPDLEWPQRPETGRYSLEAERERRYNERWAALEASLEEDSSEEEYFDEYDKEWLKDLKILPPPATPSVIQMKPFTEICATLGLDEVVLFYEGRDFSGDPLSCAETYLVYHTKDDRFLKICVKAEGKKWRQPDNTKLYPNLRDLAIAFDEQD